MKTSPFESKPFTYGQALAILFIGMKWAGLISYSWWWLVAIAFIP